MWFSRVEGIFSVLLMIWFHGGFLRYGSIICLKVLCRWLILQFLDLFGDEKSIKKAVDRHAKLFFHHKSTPESRKRTAEDILVSDKTKLAKSYSGVPTSAPSIMGASPSIQNQWAAGYGLQPQAWPQVTQAQGQQWNSGYTHQVLLSFFYGVLIAFHVLIDKVGKEGVISYASECRRIVVLLSVGRGENTLQAFFWMSLLYGHKNKWITLRWNI